MSTFPLQIDRQIETAAALEGIRFDPFGLVPVVAQEAEGGTVLMVGWANREALERTLATGLLTFWSRSRAAIWQKGETSGHTLTLVSLHLDCDGDTLLARVRPAGPACHTGDGGCFGLGSSPTDTTQPGGENSVDQAASRGEEGARSLLQELWAVIEERDRERPAGSYTTRLLEDENLRLKKLGEEVAELLTALARKEPRASEEAADLLYHLLVALRGAGRSWGEVEDELRRRGG